MQSLAAPDRLELAFLSNLEYFRELTRRSGGVVLDHHGVTCFASPHPLPFLVSGAFRTDPTAAPTEVLSRAEDFFAGLGRAVPLSALVGRDDDLIEVAKASGFTAATSPDPLQVLDRRLDTCAAPGIDFRPVTDAAGIADVIAVCRGLT